MTNPDGSLPRPRRSWSREGAVTGTAFALCLLGGVVQVDDTLSPPSAAAYVVAVLSCAVLPLRHRAPLTTLAATTACGMLVAPLDLLLTPLIVAPTVVAAYSLAVRAERRTATAALLSSAVLLVASTVLFGDLSWQDATRLGIVAAFPLVAGVLGRSAQNRRAYLAAVEERALRAEQSRDSEARHRVAEERLRVARELHDLVAHQITLANAQAMVAAQLVEARPEESRESLAQLIETTRNALDDLRATVGLLRQAGDPAAPAEPAPGLSGLPALVESFRRAGLQVSVHHEGAAGALPPGVDLTAYRIIQEALTNVTKHAGTGSARVHLRWTRDRVTITISDDGDPSGSSTGPRPEPGYGLIGMRERATAAGGELVAGSRPEGGFVVTTHLPVPPVRGTASAPGTETTEGPMADATAGGGEVGEPQ